jgi:hypothetical protein
MCWHTENPPPIYQCRQDLPIAEFIRSAASRQVDRDTPLPSGHHIQDAEFEDADIRQLTVVNPAKAFAIGIRKA